MIPRKEDLKVLQRLIRQFRVVAIIGARQVGKTTLARMLLSKINGPSVFFDLEDDEVIARFEDPMLTLKNLKGLIVIDEVQRRPELFQAIRVLADRRPLPARFLILGSAGPDLLHQSSESLAGRISYFDLSGFSLADVGAKFHKKLWFRGGFPESYLARSDRASDLWRHGFIRTFLERDLPQLGIRIRSSTLRRFWMMIAHYHGQIWNSSEFARSFGVSDSAVRHYLDLLTAALVVRQLPPWHENLSKRQVKSPKIYIADSGLLHALLNLRTLADLEQHPKVGASWEGFVLGELIHHLKADSRECFFWATHAGAELDLLIVRGNKRFGFEIKRSTAPSMTPSIRHALIDLGLKRVDIIHAGDKTYLLAANVRAVAFSRLIQDLKPLS